jgi:L-amino acid N-acyltransferase YncA
MRLVECVFEHHAQRMLDIVNEAIVNTTWVYDYVPRTSADMRAYIDERRAEGFPVVGAVGDDDRLLGYGTFGHFRHLAAYKYTIEHSVFVAAAARRRGIGRQLLLRLIELARAGDFHVMIGAIDSSNLPSIRMHESLGFELCGTMREVGYKHGRWLDAVFYQLTLDTPLEPDERTYPP